MEAAPRIIVVMGPAGAGKTTVGIALANSLGWTFRDADEFHSAENIERMRRGIGLTDADRAPWLAAIRHALEDAVTHEQSLVLACSALKEEYRHSLIPTNDSASLRFVYLRADEKLLRERLEHRHGHYAGPELLASQLQTLEEPREALWIDAALPPSDIVSRIREAFAEQLLVGTQIDEAQARSVVRWREAAPIFLFQRGAREDDPLIMSQRVFQRPANRGEPGSSFGIRETDAFAHSLDVFGRVKFVGIAKAPA